MSITFNNEKQRFTIETQNTVYIFDVVFEDYLSNVYYGQKGNIVENKPINYTLSPYPQKTNAQYTPTNWFSEFSYFGGGDFRCSSLKIRNIDGNCTTLFKYKDYEIFKGRKDIPGIPNARATENTETLAVKLYDDVNKANLTLYYTVYPEFDIISRYFTLENNGSEEFKIEKAMSLCLDLPGDNYDVISFYGRHCNERNVQRIPAFRGNMSLMSRRGSSSHQLNPFIMVADRETDEDNGVAIGFNFVYSGNFLDEIEVDQGGNTRIGIGLGEENFGYILEPSQSFTTPEAIMVYSTEGLGGISRKLHKFIRKNIVPKEPFEKRPVVLNTWEACYFDINEQVLVDFAREAKECNMDMVVMDDGWFGKRNNDWTGLGDWYENKEKFPDGLKSFIEKVKAQGVKFGIWIEPEMVNPDSDLYRAHPDWCICCKGREKSLSRTQWVLDMCNPQVLDYLKQSFEKTFKDCNIDYIKWDYNRYLSEVGSNYLPANRQDEVPFRFMLGVYELYNWFIEKFPNMMIENCSSGGGRYDLAMMSVSTQIWTSDNTNPKSRVLIQNGSQYGYPAYVMSCHVSDPGNDENYMRVLDYKYKVALGGMLGYELNILKKDSQFKSELSKQIAFYRYVEELIKHGDFYRLISPYNNKSQISSYYYASNEDTKNKNHRILLSFLQNLATENKEKYTLKIKVANEQKNYKEYFSGKIYSGKQLVDGIELETDTQDMYGVIMLFEEI